MTNEINPQSKDDILRAFSSLQVTGLDFWSDLETNRFVTPFGEAWSPSDNVRHLIKSTLPVTKALNLPKVLLQTLFGTAKEPSMSYLDLVSKYKALLAAGGTAGKFAPKPVAVAGDRPEWKSKLIERCRQAVVDLERTAARWSENDLDKYRLPHPLLGKLTVREMLLFTIYHFEHHKQNVVRRMADLKSESAAASGTAPAT